MVDVENSASKDAAHGVVPNTSGKKLWWAAAFLLMAAGGAGLAWLGTPHRSAGGEASPEPTVVLETLVVNLDGSNQRAYLRVGITLGLAQPTSHDQKDVLPVALVRDTILSVLATAEPQALMGAEGKEQLKARLLGALQERVPQLAIAHVYFTEFLVQM